MPGSAEPSTFSGQMPLSTLLPACLSSLPRVPLVHNSPYRGLLPPALSAPPKTGSSFPPSSSFSSHLTHLPMAKGNSYGLPPHYSRFLDKLSPSSVQARKTECLPEVKGSVRRAAHEANIALYLSFPTPTPDRAVASLLGLPPSRGSGTSLSF